MKKRILSLALALVLCLALVPVTAAAADENVDLDITVRDFKEDRILFENPVGYEKIKNMVQDTLGADKKPVYNLQIWKDKYGDEVTMDMLTGLFNDVSGYNMSAQKILTMAPYGSGYWQLRSSSMFPIDGELFGNEGHSHNYHFSIEIHKRFEYVQGATFEFSGDDDVWVFMNDKLVIDLGGVDFTTSASVKLDDIAADLGINIGDMVDFDMFYMERHLTGSNMNIRINFDLLNSDASEWVTEDPEPTEPEPEEPEPAEPEPEEPEKVFNASEWAAEELEKADEMGLIPDSLRGADLTQPITRAEFASVAVKVYENLAATPAIPAVTNPFTDTNDIEVLKAYNTNVMVGTAPDRFSPDTLLNREQCATALTRVFKRVTMPGWTYATDGQFTLTYTKPADFRDDARISDWAKDSVYFMAANGIISGTGNNVFAPRATTTEEQARNYASATREQTIVIAVRMVENLG